MKTEYKIIDDFQAGSKRVLVLDSDYDFGGFNKVVIDGHSYSFAPNSVKNWIIIDNFGSFKGKAAQFARSDVNV